MEGAVGTELPSADLVWLWFRGPHLGLAARMMRTSEPPHWPGGRHDPGGRYAIVPPRADATWGSRNGAWSALAGRLGTGLSGAPGAGDRAVRSRRTDRCVRPA